MKLVIGDNYISNHFKKYPDEYMVWSRDLLEYSVDWRHTIPSEVKTIINCHDVKNAYMSTLISENVNFTIALNDFCKKFSKKFIQISTADIYGNSYEWKKNTEERNDVCQGSSYVLSKRLAELLLPNALILRIKNPFDDELHDDNYIVKSLKLKKIYNKTDTQTYLPDLKRAIQVLSPEHLGIFNVVLQDAGSMLYYFKEVLHISKYDHLDVHMKEHADINSEFSEEIFHSDVNCTKLLNYMKPTSGDAAFILAYEGLKNKLISSNIVL